LDDSLRPHLASDPDFDLTEFNEHPRSGQWVFGKDGKFYFADSVWIDMKKALRK
jgi:hypothetical protein